MDKLNTKASVGAAMSAGAGAAEKGGIKGDYHLECTDGNGVVIWEENIHNVVPTGGQNALLNQGIVSGYTTLVGPYMFLISSTSFTAVSATDTMASHSGWLECAGTVTPNYGTVRPTMTLAAAAGGSVATSALSFAFTNSGTVQGIGAVFGSGATVTAGSTAGTLLSAGTLTTPQPVINGNTINATWTLTL